MKVVCIDDRGYGGSIIYGELTIGKIYTTTSSGSDWFSLVADDGIESHYQMKDFITLKNRRKKTIEDILK